ncbi:MAG: hypothetical protein IH793_07975, partial [Acidobacteria bacterium]|nr:hypothetical protein [Acidobacteriota bacterium]
TAVMVSAVGGDDAATILATLDGKVRQAGGQGLKENGVFNNAYLVAGDDSEANRASLGEFNPPFAGYYEDCVPASRTAQYVGGCQQKEFKYGVSNRSIFVA